MKVIMIGENDPYEFAISKALEHNGHKVDNIPIEEFTPRVQAFLARFQADLPDVILFHPDQAGISYGITLCRLIKRAVPSTVLVADSVSSDFSEVADFVLSHPTYRQLEEAGVFRKADKKRGGENEYSSC